MWRRTLTIWLALWPGFLLAGTIHLKNRSIITGDSASNLAAQDLEPAGIDASQLDATMDGARLVRNRDHVMVEFRAPVTQNLLSELARRRLRVTSALGSQALMLSRERGASLTGLGVTWTGRLLPNDKVSAQISRASDSPSLVLIEFHDDVTAREMEDVLRAAGVKPLAAAGRLQRRHALVRADLAQIEDLSRWDEVAYVFPAPERLLTDASPVPCLGALEAGEEVAQYVTVSSGWVANSPTGVTLNYVFTTLTTLVPTAQVQSEIVRALHAWSAIANVQFVQGSDSAAPWTVAVEFGTSVNNDPTPFDSANTLAHTYYPAPPNPEPIAGDLHFNPAENWHVGASTDIYTVALHETGHALGLGHTDNPDDVMYPYYQFGTALSVNDIGGVQSLYGAPGTSAPITNGGGSEVSTPITSTAPLSLVIAAPAGGPRTTASSVTLSGSVLNASGAATVVWQSSGGHSGQATGSPAWAISSVPLNPGVNLITVTASDASGKTAHGLVRIVRIGTAQGGQTPPAVPSQPLTMTIDSPADGSSTTAASVVVSGRASDSSAISQVTWQTNSGATGTALPSSAWTASAIPLFTGPNVVIVKIYDSQGNMVWKSITVNKTD